MMLHITDYVILNDIDKINDYVETNGDINSRDKYGKTPLYWSYRFGLEEITKILKDAGAE
jgi:ankyrin repeat protein